MVTLWLTLHLTKKLWTVEDLYETLDFTRFQFDLSKLISKNEISSQEIQLIFHGMKKVQGLNLYHQVLRKVLYNYLINYPEEQLIRAIIPIMQRSDEIQKDDKKLILQLLGTCGLITSQLSMSALIQLINYGISKKDDVYDQLIHQELIKRIPEELKFLSVNEIKKLTKYLSRIPEEINGLISQLISAELELIEDEECQLTDTRDILQTLCFLVVSMDTVGSKLIGQIFQAVNEINLDLKTQETKAISKELLFAVHRKLFPKSAELSDLEEQYKAHFIGLSDSYFCRLLVNIQQVKTSVFERKFITKPD